MEANQLSMRTKPCQSLPYELNLTPGGSFDRRLAIVAASFPSQTLRRMIQF